MSRVPILLLWLAMAWTPLAPRPDESGARYDDEGGSTAAIARLVSEGESASAVQPEPVTHAIRGVMGGVHDFSSLTGRVVDACSSCHVPHLQAVRPVERDGNQAVLDLFRMQGQRQVFVPGQYMPGASSLVCLSCHNGTVASSTIGTSHALLGDGLATRHSARTFAFRDHPIGIPYPSGREDYRPLSALQSDGRVVLPEGRVECVSCHDPHNAAGEAKMLVMSNRRSALCLACHEK